MDHFCSCGCLLKFDALPLPSVPFSLGRCGERRQAVLLGFAESVSKRSMLLTGTGSLKRWGSWAQGRGCGCGLTACGPPSVGMSQGPHHSVPANTEVSAFSVCLRLNARIPKLIWSGQNPEPLTHSVILCQLPSLSFVPCTTEVITVPTILIYGELHEIMWTKPIAGAWLIVGAQYLIFAMILLITLITVIISRVSCQQFQALIRTIGSSLVWFGSMSEGQIPSSCSLCLSHRACLLTGPATYFMFKVKCQREGKRTCRKKNNEPLHPFLIDGGWHLRWALSLGWRYTSQDSRLAFQEERGASAKVWIYKSVSHCFWVDREKTGSF